MELGLTEVDMIKIITSLNHGEYMPSNSSANHGLIAIVFVGLCTSIGFWMFMETDNVGFLTTWFWVGIGLAGIYLLTIIANSIDRRNTDY